MFTQLQVCHWLCCSRRFGSGPCDRRRCVLPFTFRGYWYHDCTTERWHTAWCNTANNHRWKDAFGECCAAQIPGCCIDGNLAPHIQIWSILTNRLNLVHPYVMVNDANIRWFKRIHMDFEHIIEHLLPISANLALPAILAQD